MDSETTSKIRQFKEIRSALLGLPLIRMYRAADMRMLHFGKEREYRGGYVGEWALHILSSWRLLGPKGMITGYSDLYRPIHEEDWSLDWDYESGNLQDNNVLQFLHSAQLQHVVEDLLIKDHGDLEMHFSGGYRIETFLNHSLEGAESSWLIFQPGDSESFFEMDQELYEQGSFTAFN
ncbi:MAG: hypothetical protein KDK71_07390 [Chlamydiia bacterium]|nr:hypothetical protein [Chlamydiia bacterium]